jgi:hypothetical protein
MVPNSLGPFVAQFPMVVALGFLFQSLIAKSPSLDVGGIAHVVGVPSFPFG